MENNPIRLSDPDGMSVTYNPDGSVTYDNIGTADATNFALGLQAYQDKVKNNNSKPDQQRPKESWWARAWRRFKKWANTPVGGLNCGNCGLTEQQANQLSKNMQTFAAWTVMIQGHMEMLNSLSAPETAVSSTVETTVQEVSTADIESYAVANQIYSGQRGINPEIVNEYVSQMENGTFNASKGAGGFIYEGKTILTDGNHRINAAIKFGLKTGDFKYVRELIKNGNWTRANPAKYGYKIYNLPVK